MKIKTTIGYHYTLIKMAKINLKKKKKVIPSPGEDVGQIEPSHIALEYANDTVILENRLTVSYKVK